MQLFKSFLVTVLICIVAALLVVALVKYTAATLVIGWITMIFSVLWFYVHDSMK